MLPADLLRLGPVRTIGLHLDSNAGVSPGFFFRGIACEDAIQLPSLTEIPGLPPGIDVVVYRRCALAEGLPTVSLGWHILRYVHPWTSFVVELQGSFEAY